MNNSGKMILIQRIRFENNPYSVERVHDFRVSIRILRGLFKFLKRELPTLAYETIDRNLRSAALILGGLREIDVLTEKCAAYVYNRPEPDPKYRQLFTDLFNKRNAEMQRVLAPNTRESMDNYLAEVEKQLAKLHFKKTKKWQAYTSKEMKRRCRKLIKAYNALDFHDYPVVHHVRKRAKTLRYSATYFAKHANPKEAAKSRKLATDIQNIAGNITDAHVNQTMLKQFAKKATSEDERELLLRISAAQSELIDAQTPK